MIFWWGLVKMNVFEGCSLRIILYIVLYNKPAKELILLKGMPSAIPRGDS